LFRVLKYRLRALLPPAIFLAITWYFGWNAIHGQSGLQAQQVQRAQLLQAQQDYAKAELLRLQWQTRVADLSGQAIEPDMLDEQAREVLNLAHPDDLVVDLPPVKSSE
jgi:cell division protein FtsB